MIPLIPRGLFPVPESPDIPYRGTIEIATESGWRYVVDLALGLLTRIRGTEEPADPDVAFPSKLRDHGRTIKFLRMQLADGKRAVFDVESLGDPDMEFTRRTTTIVRGIGALSD